LKAKRGTALSKGNSSYPEMSLALWSGASLKHGILVKAEKRYFKSSCRAAFCFSTLAAVFDDRRREDQSEDMPDMTLRMLETEWIESRSDDRVLFL
jgi:hypothetical protein